MKEEVLAKIGAGEVSMRPRWHFVGKTVLAVLGVTLLGLATLYMASFALFVLRETGVLFAPSFGLRGLVPLFLGSPWLIIFTAVLFLVVLEILVRQYSFSYRKPLLYTTVGIIAFVLFGSYAVAQVGVHERFSGYAERGELPMMGGMYRRYETLETQGMYRGVVTELFPDGFAIENRRETLTVFVSDKTRFPDGADVSLGARVVVLGEREGSVVYAVGVRPLPSGVRGGMMGGGMMNPGRAIDARR